MKNPLKFFLGAAVVIAAIAAVAIMAVRYMDVLQRQFEMLKELVARRLRHIPSGDHDDGAGLHDMDDFEPQSDANSYLNGDLSF